MTITDTVKQKKPKHKLLEKYTIKERTRKQKADIFMGIVFQIIEGNNRDIANRP